MQKANTNANFVIEVHGLHYYLVIYQVHSCKTLSCVVVQKKKRNIDSFQNVPVCKFNLYFSTLTILQAVLWYFSASNWICAKL